MSDDEWRFVTPAQAGTLAVSEGEEDGEQFHGFVSIIAWVITHETISFVTPNGIHDGRGEDHEMAVMTPDGRVQDSLNGCCADTVHEFLRNRRRWRARKATDRIVVNDPWCLSQEQLEKAAEAADSCDCQPRGGLDDDWAIFRTGNGGVDFDSWRRNRADAFWAGLKATGLPFRRVPPPGALDELMSREGLSFADAALRLAKDYGFPISANEGE